MAGSLLPIDYRPARFATKGAAREATKKLPHTQAIYIGWFAAKYWGVPGRGWYVMLSSTLGGRLATEEEIEAGRAQRPSSWARIATLLGWLLLMTGLAYPPADCHLAGANWPLI